MTPQETQQLATSASEVAERVSGGQGGNCGVTEALRTWTLTIAAPADWINLNQRHHWSKKAQLTKAWRLAGHDAAECARFPQGLTKVHVTAIITKPTRRAFDVHNLIPTLKAAIDGLVDYGLVADDSTKYLTGPDMRVDPEIGPNTVTFLITELEAR